MTLARRKSDRIQSPAVAAKLGVTAKTVREMAERGEIPSAARMGHRWTFDAETIRRFVRRKEEEVCQTTSIRGVGRGGRVLKLADATSDEAYERAIGLRPKSAATPG